MRGRIFQRWRCRGEWNGGTESQAVFGDGGTRGPRCAELLLESVAELQKQHNEAVTLEQISQHLIQAKLITVWHDEKLRAGRYRGFFLGKYKLLKLIGSGGMCNVYLAEHKILRQQRAIKVLPRGRVADKSYLDRFYREGRAAAALNHPNIVRVYDIDHEGDSHYLVMEYVEGWNLFDYVKEHGPLSYRDAAEYTLQSAIGLQHAHESKLVHRDVKPANLLVTEANLLKISDLGLALFREDDYSLTMAYNERVLGTADYLAPEQAVNSHTVDHRADIYGLGCSLYYLLTGQPPFPTGTLAQRIAMHQSSQPQPLEDYRPDCPESLRRIGERMMRKSPDDRFQNCRDLEIDLREVLNECAAQSSQSTQMISSPSIVTSPRDVARGYAAVNSKAVAGGSSRKTGSKPPSNAGAAKGVPAAAAPVEAHAISQSLAHSNQALAAPTTETRSQSKSNRKKLSPPENKSAGQGNQVGSPLQRPIIAQLQSAKSPVAVRREELVGLPTTSRIVRRRAKNRDVWIVAGLVVGLGLLLVLAIFVAFRLTVSADARPIRQSDQWPSQTNGGFSAVSASNSRNSGYGNDDRWL